MFLLVDIHKNYVKLLLFLHLTEVHYNLPPGFQSSAWWLAITAEV